MGHSVIRNQKEDLHSKRLAQNPELKERYDNSRPSEQALQDIFKDYENDFKFFDYQWIPSSISREHQSSLRHRCWTYSASLTPESVFKRLHHPEALGIQALAFELQRIGVFGAIHGRRDFIEGDHFLPKACSNPINR